MAAPQKKKRKGVEEKVKKGLKETVMGAAEAVAHVGEIAQDASDTLDAITSGQGKLAKVPLAGTLAVTAGTAANAVAAAGDVASCVAEAVDSGRTREELREGKVRVHGSGSTLTSILQHLAHSDRDVVLVGENDEPVAAVVPWSRYDNRRSHRKPADGQNSGSDAQDEGLDLTSPGLKEPQIGDDQGEEGAPDTEKRKKKGKKKKGGKGSDQETSGKKAGKKRKKKNHD